MDGRLIYENLKASLDPVEAAKHSFFHYHTRGMHYVNLLRTPRLTAKVYFATREYRPNINGWAVNPHDHAYNFDTCVLQGAARNIIFDRDENNSNWHYFTYRSPMADGEGFQSQGLAGLKRRTDFAYNPGMNYHLSHDEIHTIAIDVGTVLFLLQYEDKPKSHTNFYHDLPSPPDTSGLYKPMTPHDVERMIAEYLP